MVNWWKIDLVRSRLTEALDPNPEDEALLQGQGQVWLNGWNRGWRVAAGSEVLFADNLIFAWKKVANWGPIIQFHEEYMRGVRQAGAELESLIQPNQPLVWVRQDDALDRLLLELGLPASKVGRLGPWEPFCTWSRYSRLPLRVRGELEGLPRGNLSFQVAGSRP